MTVPADTSSPAELLAYSHFGPDIGNVGQDILDDLRNSPGANGAGSLGDRNLVFWIQQLGDPVSYRLDFLVPEPGGIALVALGAVFSLLIARRRRSDV
jgi:hypothetical protein